MITRLKKILILLFTISLIPTALQARPHRLLGKFIYLSPQDKRNVSGHEYFFYLSTSTGQQMAYPISFYSKKIKDSVKKNLNKSYFVEGDISLATITQGEIKKEIKVLNIKNANAIELKDISASTHYDPKGIKIGKKITIMDPNKKNPVTIQGINDTVTNITIFTAGAALLASILLGK